MSGAQARTADAAEDDGETARRVWVKRVLAVDVPPRKGPKIGLQRDPEVAFNRSMSASMDALGAARGTPAIDDAAAKAKDDLEAAMSRMVKAANAKDFAAASTALGEARTAGDAVQSAYMGARDGWPAALGEVTKRLDPATTQARSLLPGEPADGKVAKALDAATIARTAAERAASEDDYRSAYAALPDLSTKTDALGEAVAAEKTVSDAATAFNRRLNRALDALGAARMGPASTDLAETSRETLVEEQAKALTAAKTRDFATADQALTAAIAAADVVNREAEQALSAWRTAQSDMEGKLPPLSQRLQALPPGQAEAQTAHKAAQDAVTQAEAAGDEQDYRKAMQLLATARDAAAKLSDLLDGAEQKLAYDTKLATVQPVLDAGGAAKAAGDVAATAKTALAKALGDMATAVGAERYADALLALGKAEAAAKTVTGERDKAKTSFEQAYPAAEQAHATAKGAHTGKPASDAATLDLGKAADDAKAAAAKARDEGDWGPANAAVKTLTDAVTAFDVAYKAEWAVRDTTKVKRDDLAGRITAKTGLDTINPAHLKAKAAALAALAKLDAGTSGPSATASGLATAAEVTVIALEAAQPETAAQKGARTGTAATTVAGLDDAGIAALTIERRAELALDLIAKGQPTGAAKTQLRRLYDKAGMDPAYITKRQAIQRETATKIKDIPGAAALMTEWDDVRDATEEAAFQVKLKAFLRKAQEEQSKVLKIGDVPLTFFSTPASPGGGVTFGQYNPGSRDIQLNSHPDGMPSFRRALATILHENTHSHQHNRIDDLKAGKIAPDDPEFGQILMFAVNNEDDGYVPGSDPEYQLYKKQPIEEDAWRQGDDGADVVIAMLNGTYVAV